MRGKLILVLGLATGYVLGSRAGRPRYEQIKSGAEKVWNLAPVQQAAGTVKSFAGERVDVLQAKAGRGAKKVVSSLLNLDDSKSKPKSTPKATSDSKASSDPKATSTTTMTPATPAPATAATDTDE
ncbi:YtxH domain-containing protein [Agreia sp.]|uniref:YtxH domain-containing protein n=1 Tax=Agreia sp. TaxID=1872416 RepID=UPI0035BBA2EA